MQTTFLTEIHLPECPLAEGLRQDGTRDFGLVWCVLRSEADPFPSSPHAHNLESGLKLDLGVGRLYFVRKDTVHAISFQNLL